MSTDGGASWGEVDGALAPQGPLVIQLLEKVDPVTQPLPSLVLQLGAIPLASMSTTRSSTTG